MENENKKKELTPEERAIIRKRNLEELDEMLAEHERFKEEYGRAFEGLTAEERIKLRVKYYGMVRDFFEEYNASEKHKLKEENENE